MRCTWGGGDSECAGQRRTRDGARHTSAVKDFRKTLFFLVIFDPTLCRLLNFELVAIEPVVPPCEFAFTTHLVVAGFNVAFRHHCVVTEVIVIAALSQSDYVSLGFVFDAFISAPRGTREIVRMGRRISDSMRGAGVVGCDTLRLGVFVGERFPLLVRAGLLCPRVRSRNAICLCLFRRV